MSLLEHAPRFETESATKLAKELYGIQATAKLLPSERDQNFLLETESREKFVLKIANALEDRAILEAQNEAMNRVAKSSSLCQRVVETLSGDTIAEVQSLNGTNHFVRLVTYLSGVPLGNIKRHSPELFYDLGRAVAKVDKALSDFDRKAIRRNFHWDTANGLHVCREHEALIADKNLRELVNKLLADYEHNAAPLLPSLRKSAIHNDANDYNVLVGGGNDFYSRNQSVVGLIDFGDIVYSYTVGDLAIAMAYAILDKSDPLTAAAQIVKGYNAEYTLDENEITALFYMICMRLCMSVCIAAHQQNQRPDDEYLSVSQEPIRKTLPKLAQIHPRFAEYAFRNACGLEPVRSSEKVTNFLRANANNFASVLEEDLRTEKCLVLDLSVGSPLISGDEKENTEPVFTKRFLELMKSANAKIGVGRYDEPRLIYTSSLFGKGENPTDERRTIHLGIDLFIDAGKPIFAPLDGEVHAFGYNAAPLDYGHLIILKHITDDACEFFTLYGHLSKESIEGLRVGQQIGKGERFATIGTPSENGGWSSHLHFQIITDLLELDRDFPGVARASQRDVWKSLSPDPNLMLGIPERWFPSKTPDKNETLSARRKRIGRNLSIAYREPLKIARGWMQYLYDENGRRYLDAYNNVPHVGHCHPRVVKALREQASVLNTNTRYLHDNINRFAELLCSTLPEPLSVCFFLNSASEANELALRLARARTKQRDMIVLEAAYHGHTNTLIDISPYKHDGHGGAGAPSWVHTAPVADVYRGAYKRDDEQAGAKYAHHVFEIIERLKRNGVGLAGFIAESLPSVGGQIVFPDGYLAAVYKYVREAGGVCIADEVQTGYGRIGTRFYGFQAQNVTPDIVVLGKPIGNGHPLAAVIATPEIAESFDNGMEFFSTFGGNPVSCAVGLEALNIVLEENLQEHALSVGNRMLEGLRPMIERYPIVGDARGSGLFLGVELVRDRETLEPATEEASFISNRMREHGILLGVDGPLHNVIKIRPPMPFNKYDADFLVAALDKILSENFAA
jgi:4-aminobutyrate aminotransferase-like enzyme/Ser/Thr protein kinase RdoA (MazF antagonist)